MPELTAVESSMLSYVGYDGELQELTAVFKGGATYVYENVSAEEFAALMEAPSLGRYFGEHIRPKTCRQVG